MKEKWRYGNAWEQFPIQPGEIWSANGHSWVAVHNLFEPLPTFMLTADMLFVDPPFNLGQVNTFYTKAGRADYLDAFSAFEVALFQRIADIAPHTCYLEVGRQAVDRWEAELQRLYPAVQRWDVVYYRKHPCHILRASQRGPTAVDYTGMDEAKVIAKAAQVEDYRVLGDFCMGQGLVGLAAHDAGKPFVGTELNPRRLAVLLQKLAKRGAVVERIA